MKLINLDKQSWSISTFRWCSIMFIIASAAYGMAVYQRNLDHRITDLFIQNQHDHVQIMDKLNSIENRFDLYTLKRQVEDCFVYTSRIRDQKIEEALGTNIPVVLDELEFRSKIRRFLDH